VNRSPDNIFQPTRDQTLGVEVVLFGRYSTENGIGSPRHGLLAIYQQGGARPEGIFMNAATHAPILRIITKGGNKDLARDGSKGCADRRIRRVCRYF
jgi:hypothetical protein